MLTETLCSAENKVLGRSRYGTMIMCIGEWWFATTTLDIYFLTIWSGGGIGRHDKMFVALFGNE